MFPTHLEFLRFLKAQIDAQTYIEVGVATGATLFDKPMAPVTIGVDPAYYLSVPLNISGEVHLLREESDAFFAKGLFREASSKPIDFAFIDGLHQSDAVIRDFRNIEAISHKNSIITIHDIYPRSAKEASRDINEGGNWMGDVFRATHALRKFRPDLKLLLIHDVPLSGIGVIYNLDPANRDLTTRYDEIVEYMNTIDYDRDFDRDVLPTYSSINSSEFHEFVRLMGSYRDTSPESRRAISN